MKSRICTFCVMAITLFLFCGEAVAADKPPLQKWDFGYVPQKTEVSHVLYIKNLANDYGEDNLLDFLEVCEQNLPENEG